MRPARCSAVSGRQRPAKGPVDRATLERPSGRPLFQGCRIGQLGSAGPEPFIDARVYRIRQDYFLPWVSLSCCLILMHCGIDFDDFMLATTARVLVHTLSFSCPLWSHSDKEVPAVGRSTVRASSVGKHQLPMHDTRIQKEGTRKARKRARVPGSTALTAQEVLGGAQAALLARPRKTRRAVGRLAGTNATLAPSAQMPQRMWSAQD